jgi:hypothetical protein
MTTPASLQDFPHIMQAHEDGRIRIAQRKDTGVVARTIALSLAALLAPVIAGTAIGMVTQNARPTEKSQIRAAHIALAVASQARSDRLR